MILVIDVGNTNVVIGAYKNTELVGSWRMATVTNKTADETGTFIMSVLNSKGIQKSHIEHCIVSSVVPDILYSTVHAIRKYFAIDAMVVSNKMKMSLKMNKRENPKELGADRIVNCEAVINLYGGKCIVIDYGTATTYDVIDSDNEFITGITAPGIKISAEALFQRAALLSRVELAMPSSCIAANTTESIQAGIIFGHIGETNYIVTRLKNELNMPDAKVIATGGLARVISLGTDVFDEINPTLTLEGLRILYEKNK